MTEYYRPDYTPEWFHLENYEPLKDMSREEIYPLLLVRYLNYNFYIIEGYEKARRDILFLDNPLKAGSISKLYSLENSISDIAVFDFINIVREPSELFDLLLVTDEGEKVINYAKASMMKTSDKVPAIVVDLDYPDEKILDDMRAWLKQRRGKERERLTDNEIFGNPLSSQLRGLIDNKVIPCMDLIFWGECNGVKYTNAQLSDMLFPLQGVGEDKVRKKTRDEAIKYLTTSAYKDIL